MHVWTDLVSKRSWEHFADKSSLLSYPPVAIICTRTLVYINSTDDQLLGHRHTLLSPTSWFPQKLTKLINPEQADTKVEQCEGNRSALIGIKDAEGNSAFRVVLNNYGIQIAYVYYIHILCSIVKLSYVWHYACMVISIQKVQAVFPGSITGREAVAENMWLFPAIFCIYKRALFYFNFYHFCINSFHPNVL